MDVSKRPPFCLTRQPARTRRSSLVLADAAAEGLWEPAAPWGGNATRRGGGLLVLSGITTNGGRPTTAAGGRAGSAGSRQVRPPGCRTAATGRRGCPAADRSHVVAAIFNLHVKIRSSDWWSQSTPTCPRSSSDFSPAIHRWSHFEGVLFRSLVGHEILTPYGTENLP